MMAKLIKDKFEDDVKRRSVRRLLAQLGITLQKPLHRAQERDEAVVERWLKKDYPKSKPWRSEKRPESSLATPLTCAPIIMPGARGVRGRKPHRRNHSTHHRMSLISTITARGHMRFMIKEKDGANAAVFMSDSSA